MNIEYNNITLRALEPADVEMLYKWENTLESWHVSNLHAPISKHNLQRYIEASHRDVWESKELRLIIENEKKEAAGTIELFDFEPYHSRAGIGIMIYETNERRKGLALNALETMELYARNELGLAQLYANISATNRASLKLFEKAGYQITGTKTKWIRTPFGWEDEYLLQKWINS
ncbi:MAG: GNAT family N-acetyltransferase [Prolixibacteraceae bacterium]|nr:GNAT family N-acetyltransferase [Prolixibacteraceae bacterium]MBN2648761.1 GNAT family N-acetyltransferase [Prolixibacteraceae bacterium]